MLGIQTSSLYIRLRVGAAALRSWRCYLSTFLWGLVCVLCSLLGGSWVVISGVISPLIGVISIVTLLITPLITTREPPSTATAYDCKPRPKKPEIKNTPTVINT